MWLFHIGAKYLSYVSKRTPFSRHYIGRWEAITRIKLGSNGEGRERNDSSERKKKKKWKRRRNRTQQLIRKRARRPAKKLISRFRVSVPSPVSTRGSAFASRNGERGGRSTLATDSFPGRGPPLCLIHNARAAFCRSSSIPAIFRRLLERRWPPISRLITRRRARKCRIGVSYFEGGEERRFCVFSRVGRTRRDL